MINNMSARKIIAYAFLHAVTTVIYVALIALIITNGNTLFGKTQSILTTMAFLLTFVVSAAITGSLVLGRPALWYFNGNKNEAIKLALYTIAFICLITFILLIILALVAK